MSFKLIRHENATVNTAEIQWLPIKNSLKWVKDATYNSSAILTGAQSKTDPSDDGKTASLVGLTWKNYGGTESWTVVEEDIQPGCAMVFSSGELIPATGTTKPTYVTMGVKKASDTDRNGAVARITPDMVFEVETSADASSNKIGTVVTIDGTGYKVTATASSGVATIVKNDAKASGDSIEVRIL